MSVIGTLEIQMMADIARLRTDMADAKATVGGAMQDIEKAVSFAKNALVAFAGVASVAGFANMIKGAIDATGALHDMAIQTGASEAALGEFRKMGAYTETSADSIAGAMNKLARNMLAAGADTGAAGVAIQALGLNFDTFKKMSPEDQMIAVAKAMNGFADGADKGAAAQALFGKEGAKLLPFLKDLGQGADEITEKLTDQEVALKKTQAALADAFGDNLIQIRKEADGWKKDLATGMTPALYEASQAFLDVSHQTGSFKDEISKLSKDGTIADWTRTAITGLTYLLDTFEGLIVVVKSAGLIIGATMAAIGDGIVSTFTAIGQAASGEFSAAIDTMTGSANRQRTIMQELAGDLDKTWSQETLGSKLRARMEDLKGVGIESEAAKPKLDVSDALAKTEAAQKAAADAAKLHMAELKKQQAEYDKAVKAGQEYMLSIDGLNQSLQMEIDTGSKLSDADKQIIELEQKMITGKIAMTDAQYEHTVEVINSNAEMKRQIEITKQNTDENFKNLQSLYDKTAKLQDDTRAAEEARAEAEAMLPIETSATLKVGERTQALGDLRVARLLDKAAAEDAIAKLFEEAGVSDDVVKAHRDLADAYRASSAEAEKGTHLAVAKETAAEWNKTTKSISDGLTNAFIDGLSNGKSLFVNFRDHIEKLFMDMVLKPTVSLVLQPFADALNGVINSALSSLTGGILGNTAGGSAAASAAGSVAGSAATGGSISGAISSAGSAVGSALGIDAAGFTGTGVTGALGIGASAGAGVTVGSVTTGSVVATDLGVLGAESAAASAGGSELLASSAALGPLGVAAAAAFLIATGNLLGDDFTDNARPLPDYDNAKEVESMKQLYANVAQATGRQADPNVRFSFMAGTTDHNGDYFDVTAYGDGGTVYHAPSQRPLTADAIRMQKMAAVYSVLFGSPMEQINDSQSVFNGPGVTSAMTPYLPPGFASGGDHPGGLRIVGERGPELEATGPSRIFNAEQTASMLRSGGANDSELLVEMKLLRRCFEQNTQINSRLTRIFQNLTPNGDALQTRAIT